MPEYNLDDAKGRRGQAFVFADRKTAASARRALELMDPAHESEAKRLAEKYANLALEHSQGHAFEWVEALKFNADAAAKGHSARAVTTESSGQPHSAADIHVFDQASLVKEVQAKSYGGVAGSLTELRHEKYAGMGRLVPSDQLSDVVELLQKRLERDPAAIYYSGHQDVSANVAGELEHDGVSSGGTARAEAEAAAADPLDWLLERRDKAASTSVVSATLVGGLAAGSRMAFDEVTEAMGEGAALGSLADVLCEAGANIARVAVTGGAESGLARAMDLAMSSGKLPKGLSMVAPAQMASHVVAMADAAWSYGTGAIEREELLSRCGDEVVQYCLSWAMGVIGQTVIPIPVVGAVAGTLAAEAVGKMVEQSIIIAQAAIAEADAAEERLVELQVEVMHAIKRSEEERLLLEDLIAKEEVHHLDVLLPLVERVEFEIDGDPAETMSGLAELNRQFAAQLEWQTLPEFDRFMTSAEALQL